MALKCPAFAVAATPIQTQVQHGAKPSQGHNDQRRMNNPPSHRHNYGHITTGSGQQLVCRAVRFYTATQHRHWARHGACHRQSTQS